EIGDGELRDRPDAAVGEDAVDDAVLPHRDIGKEAGAVAVLILRHGGGTAANLGHAVERSTRSEDHGQVLGGAQARDLNGQVGVAGPRAVDEAERAVVVEGDAVDLVVDHRSVGGGNAGRQVPDVVADLLKLKAEEMGRALCVEELDAGGDDVAI